MYIFIIYGAINKPYRQRLRLGAAVYGFGAEPLHAGQNSELKAKR